MNKNQLALKSLTEELSRLAHAAAEADDVEEEAVCIKESLDLACLCREIPGLCPHHIAVLKGLVTALLEEQWREPAHDDEKRIVQ